MGMIMAMRVRLPVALTVLALLAALGGAEVARAATFTWIGASTDHATDPANWVGGVAPGSTDDVLFDGSSAGEISQTCGLGSNLTWNSVTFSLDTGGALTETLEIDDTFTLTILNTVTVASSGTDTAVLTVSGTLNIGGGLSASAGLLIQGQSVFTKRSDGGTSVDFSAGSTTWENSSSVTNNFGAVLVSGGSVTLNSDITCDTLELQAGTSLDLNGNTLTIVNSGEAVTPLIVAGTATLIIGSGTLTVEDTIAPVVTLIGGDVFVEAGSTYTELSATATDNLDDDAVVTATIQITGGPVDTGVLGIVTLTYTATDSSGNIGTTTREVTVGASAVPALSPLATTLLGLGILASSCSALSKRRRRERLG